MNWMSHKFGQDLSERKEDSHVFWKTCVKKLGKLAKKKSKMKRNELKPFLSFCYRRLEKPWDNHPMHGIPSLCRRHWLLQQQWLFFKPLLKVHSRGQLRQRMILHEQYSKTCYENWVLKDKMGIGTCLIISLTRKEISYNIKKYILQKTTIFQPDTKYNSRRTHDSWRLIRNCRFHFTSPWLPVNIIER